MILNHIYIHHSFRLSDETVLAQNFEGNVKLTRFSLSACNLQRMDLHYAIPNQLYMHIHDVKYSSIFTLNNNPLDCKYVMYSTEYTPRNT